MLNATNYNYFTLSPYTDFEQGVIAIIMIFISLGAIFGNLLVFIAYFKVKRLQRATNYFILSLAAADLFVGMLVINIFTMYMLLGHWPSSHFTCLLWLCSDYWVFQASVFGVLMISIDRYLSIRFPHRYRHRRTPGNVRTAIIVMWIFSFTLWVPLIVTYYFTDDTDGMGGQYCQVGTDSNVYITALASSCAYVIPVFVIICLAIHTFQLLLKMKHPRRPACHKRESCTGESITTSERSVTESSSTDYDCPLEINQPNSPMPDKLKNKRICKIMFENKKTSSILVKGSPRVPLSIEVKNVCQKYKNLDDFQRIATFNIIIAIAFVITVFPYGIISVVEGFCGKCVSTEWWHFAYIMCYINSLLNPLCYAFGNKNFNRAFKTILRISRPSRRHEIDYSRTGSCKEKNEEKTCKTAPIV